MGTGEAARYRDSELNHCIRPAPVYGGESEAADEDGDSPKFVAVSRLPRTVTRVTFVFINRSRLACFNTSKMEPQEFRLKTPRSAATFVKALVGDKPDSAPRD